MYYSKLTKSKRKTQIAKKCSLYKVQEYRSIKKSNVRLMTSLYTSYKHKYVINLKKETNYSLASFSLCNCNFKTKKKIENIKC